MTRDLLDKNLEFIHDTHDALGLHIKEAPVGMAKVAKKVTKTRLGLQLDLLNIFGRHGAADDSDTTLDHAGNC